MLPWPGALGELAPAAEQRADEHPRNAAQPPINRRPYSRTGRLHTLHHIPSPALQAPAPPANRNSPPYEIRLRLRADGWSPQFWCLGRGRRFPAAGRRRRRADPTEAKTQRLNVRLPMNRRMLNTILLAASCSGAMFAPWSMWSLTAQDNSCVEDGPHTNEWLCCGWPSVTAPGSLSTNTIYVCAGGSITPPTASGTTFNYGQKCRYIWYKCPENGANNHTEYQPSGALRARSIGTRRSLPRSPTPATLTSGPSLTARPLTPPAQR